MTQRKRGGEASETSVINDDADGEAGDNCAKHGKGQDTADKREKLGLVQTVASIEYDCRQEVNKKSLGVERYQKADFPAVVVQVRTDDEAEENGGHRFRENVKFGQEQGVS